MKQKVSAKIFGIVLTFLLPVFANPASAVEMRPVLQNADIQTIAAAAKTAMKSHHTNGCIAIADADGEILLLQRDDDAAPSCISSVLGKVEVAARFQTPSEVFYNKLTGQQSLMMLTIPEMTALPGGLPLLSNRQIVGAVAISTPDPAVDVQIVKAAVAGFQ
jgi:glc operon protein GlcG